MCTAQVQRTHKQTPVWTHCTIKRNVFVSYPLGSFSPYRVQEMSPFTWKDVRRTAFDGIHNAQFYRIAIGTYTDGRQKCQAGRHLFTISLNSVLSIVYSIIVTIGAIKWIHWCWFSMLQMTRMREIGENDCHCGAAESNCSSGSCFWFNLNLTCLSRSPSLEQARWWIIATK